MGERLDLDVPMHPMMAPRDGSGQDKCPVCNSTGIAVFFQVFQVPVHCNVLWSVQDAALRAPKGDVRLGFCGDCGHVFNLVFDPALIEYTQDYENSLHFSPRFQSYAEWLAARLVDRHDLHNRDIIEIGCGKGDFLKLLCELGGNRGVGFDPSYVPEQGVGEAAERITVIQDLYSERYASYKADFICCRHVLEHVQSPGDFLTTVRRAIGDRSGTPVFFEVPNGLFTLRDLGIWDLIYEHCSYFSPSSLSRLFAACGFDVCDVAETYEGQFLCIEAVPGEGLVNSRPNPRDDPAGVARDVASFADRYRGKIRNWHRHLGRMARGGQRAVVWGAGSKGVTFLNLLETQGQIAYAVDINPRKQGMYVAGTGQQIVPPEFLREYQPDVVIVMNPVYEDEIRRFTGGLGLTPEFMCA
jgi:SAM-dependent methyltransferase